MACTSVMAERVEQTARQQGLVLGEQHWLLLHFAVDYYKQNGRMCNLRTLIRGTGIPKGDVYRLFTGNPIALICQLTGLPKPEEC